MSGGLHDVITLGATKERSHGTSTANIRIFEKVSQCGTHFDPSNPTINEQDFETKDWTSSEFGHIEDREELPPNMSEPRGMGFTIIAKGMRTMHPIL